MTNGRPVLKGTIHGKRIDLDQEAGLPDGQVVTVTVQPLREQLPPGEGIRRSAGAWADEADELDKFLARNRQVRERCRPEMPA